MHIVLSFGALHVANDEPENYHMHRLAAERHQTIGLTLVKPAISDIVSFYRSSMRTPYLRQKHEYVCQRILASASFNAFSIPYIITSVARCLAPSVLL